MNIADLFNIIDWQMFLVIYAAVFGSSSLIFRRCAICIYDPGWIVVAALSVSVALVAYLFEVEGLGSNTLILFMFSAFLAFLLGIRIADAAFQQFRPRRPKFDLNAPAAKAQLQSLERILYVLQVMILTLLTLRAVTQGLPIMAADPELAKVEVNSAGFGLITRLMSPAVTMSLSITFLLAAKRVMTRRQWLTALLPSVLTLVASGAKGGLIGVLVSFTAVQAYLMSTDTQYRAPRAARIVMLSVTAIVGYALLVLLLRGAGAGEGDPLAFALTTFGVRLIAFSDGVFYFFLNDLYRTLSFQPYDYVWDYFIAPLLAMLRLVEYTPALGLQMTSELFGAEKMGPNPTVFVEGYAYFGPVLGVAYAFCIGILFQALRSGVFSRFARFRCWGFLRFSLLFPLAQVVAVDMLLFVAEVINALLVASIVWVVHEAIWGPRSLFRSSTTK